MLQVGDIVKILPGTSQYHNLLYNGWFGRITHLYYGQSGEFESALVDSDKAGFLQAVSFISRFPLDQLVRAPSILDASNLTARFSEYSFVVTPAWKPTK